VKRFRSGRTKETGNLRSWAAVLLPHIEGGVILADAANCRTRSLVWLNIRYPAVDPIDPGASFGAELTRFFVHFVRNEGFGRPRFWAKRTSRDLVSEWEPTAVPEAEHGHRISHLGSDDTVKEFFVGGL
jgi:hypothetical protein